VMSWPIGTKAENISVPIVSTSTKKLCAVRCAPHGFVWKADGLPTHLPSTARQTIAESESMQAGLVEQSIPELKQAI